ncbi:excalibur calcium-binding domain-containing protein [Shewanella woodyi]|uniref:excalibur calcium-binding domain-containing protein n=1 Tax=Shewanella woodyi TaxID=60961 RepID=UPI0007F975C9|nr:excalibur calcium-binding domain-containing protein [Shewanella woodyi]
MERGTLVRWNDEKGFGFIKPETGNGKDVFIHISALKHMARKPVIGDGILFLTEQQTDGKIKAIKANIEGVAVIASTSRHQARTTHNSRSHNSKSHNRHSRQSKSSSVILIPLLVILALGIYGYKRFEALTAQSNTQTHSTNEPSQQPAAKIEWIQPKETFHCEAGKLHCSQMRSCAEAKFYNRNCPGTKMDGDGDGIPCERQHCGY